MPYIPQAERRALLYSRGPDTPGELNYELSKTVWKWIQRRGGASYSNLNAAIGVLECCKQELYRRVVAPYEDTKCALNGDVYPDTGESPCQP